MRTFFRPCAALSMALFVASCVGSSAPRLPVTVAAAIAAEPMCRLESADMILYYPEARHDEAVRFAGHVGACVAALRLRALGHSRMSLHKVVLILPELPFNNAFVAPRAVGYEELGVVPTLSTTDQFALENGLPPDAAEIACHEVTHFVHLQQIEGFSLVWNTAFGEAYTPQLGLDPWFMEGLAVYYETGLQPGTGRLAWPFWQGVFAAGVAGHRLDGGDLNYYGRDFHGGNHYLLGSHFVKFLADRYGEDKLWKLIGIQARSILFPFGVNVRFWQAYDKSLSTLIDEFADDVSARTPVVARPPEQRVLRPAGWSARYARARDGTEALLSSDRDEPARLRVFAPDGRRLVDYDLTDVVPPRRLATSAPTVSGGLSFTADGRSLYFVAIDQAATYLASRLVRFDIATRTLEIVVRDLGGPGGSVSPDGRRYFFARADGDHHDLAVVELSTGKVQVLDVQPHGAYVAQPRVSPDGTQVVATTFDGVRFGLALFDATTGHRLRALPTGTLIAEDASWTDDGRILLLGSETAEKGFQVHVMDLRDGATKQLSHAPYLAFAPQAVGGTLRFLNREGWSWTLDEIALPAPAPGAAAPTAAAPPPAAAPPVLFAPTVAAPASGQMPPAPPALILSDAPASSLDRLFVPQLYSPLFAVTGAGDSVFGLSVTGADRLERHRWTLTGLYEPVLRTPSFLASYSNRQLAPVTLTIAAQQVTEREKFFFADLPNTFTLATARDRLALASATRSFFGNPLSAGLDLDERHLTDLNFPPGVSPPPELRRLAGAFLAARYAGAESTPYTGTRRLFYAATKVAVYPASWGTLRTDLLDARGELAFTTPLPLLRRHTLSLDLVGRALALDPGPQSFPYLQVGGLPSSVLWRHPNGSLGELGTAPDVPPGMTFSEPLRGFEDHAFVANRVAIADASYLYPFIIDRGSASTLGILPASFLRQIDLNLFGVGALDDLRGRHAAAGGAVVLDGVLGTVPLSFTYQIARRITDDHALTQLVLLSN